MAAFRVILVEPKSQGNVGAVARVMKNFGQLELAVVRCPPLLTEARGRALHAWDVVESAKKFETIRDALQGCDYVVGTSARIPGPEKTYLRNPVNVSAFPPMVQNMKGKVGLLFGREDFGLFNEELELCDLLVTIPTSELYRSLNLSHAVSIVLYEVHRQLGEIPVRELTPMSEEMRRHFQDSMDQLIRAMNLPDHQERNTKTVYRKLFGRAVPSAWEYYVLMGIIRRCLQRFGIEIPNESLLGDFELPEGLEEEFLRILDPKA